MAVVMNIERKRGILEWGKLDVSLFGAQKDWYGEALEAPIGFSFAIDDKYLWFIATHSKPAMVHPDARPGQFTRELYKYDVAEFFLYSPETKRYLEFNLAPNGAWWAAEFSGPREGMGEAPLQGVRTHSEMGADGSWLVAAQFELDELRDRFFFGPDSTMNTSFIINSPEQKFVSVTDLGGGEPDFHQPDKFKKVSFVNEDKLKDLTGV